MITPVKKVTSIIIACFIVVALILSFYHFRSAYIPLPTYFTYSNDELYPLTRSNSTEEMTPDSLRKWDTILFDLVRKNKFTDVAASRVYAYFYTAQRDAAFLSDHVKHHFEGSLDSVSANVLCLFFQADCSDLRKQMNTDSYSDKLADIVLSKVQQRMQLDKENTKPYPEKSGSEYWIGIRPFMGQETGSWKTWLIQSSDQFRAPVPPAYGSPEWRKQLQMTKTALNQISPWQTKSVVFWAGNPGTVTPPGQWLILANDYMESKNIPLAKILLVRSVLAMGMADAVIAVFDSKYTYWVKRPNMLDPTIQTIMPTPNHPSYPAGHSTISSAAATILSYYFPDNKDYWVKNANEASQGRVWGGIHFTIDAEQGFIMGHKVGETIIKMQSK